MLHVSGKFGALRKCDCTLFSSADINALLYVTLGAGLGLDFSMDVFNVDEDDGSVEVCMYLTNLPAEGLECDLIIPLNLVDGKAGEVITV